jgi:hypothetical protein
MKVRWKSVVFLLWVLTLSGFPSKSEADIVRGKILQTSRMGNGAPESPLLSQKLEDLWLIALEEEQDLLKGIEIFIEAPKEAQTYRGTYAFYLYGKISPTPTAPPPRALPNPMRGLSCTSDPSSMNVNFTFKYPCRQRQAFPYLPTRRFSTSP